MGLVGSVGGYAIYAAIRRAVAGRKGILIAAMLAAWFSVLLAAGAFSIELAAVVGRDDFFRILSWMALVHAAIGLGEAIITGVVVRFVLLRRPDLLEGAGENTEKVAGANRWVQTVVAGLGISMAVAVFLAPFASEQPDGLEFVGEKLGFLRDVPPVSPLPAPMADYQMPLPGLEHVKLATAVAGLVGTVVVFCVGWGLGRVFPHSSCSQAGGAAPDVAS